MALALLSFLFQNTNIYVYINMLLATCFFEESKYIVVDQWNMCSWHLLMHAISVLKHSFMQNCLEASHELFSLQSLKHFSLSLLHTRTHEKKYFRCSGVSLPVVCGSRERYMVINPIRGRLPRQPASCNTRGLYDSEAENKGFTCQCIN